MEARQRYIPLTGLKNTRELGGYRSSIGVNQQIKWGLIYRSGSPEHITDADKAELEKREIKTVVDFRSADEKTAVFDLSTIKNKIELPIDAGNLMGAVLENGKWQFNSNPEEARKEMIKLYGILVKEAIPRYRVLFSLLADPGHTPLLFHCSAGKDRTGLAAALILHALGVERDTIINDYLESTENLRSYWEPYIEFKPHMLSYMTVKVEYIMAAFMAIDEYGGIDRYLANELGADIKRLQKLYLEPIMSND